jgi:hypothetical protein
LYFLEEEVLCQLLQARLGAGDDPRDVAGLAPDALGLANFYRGNSSSIPENTFSSSTVMVT